MDLFQVIFRFAIQSIVIGAWGMILLSFAGWMVGFVWVKLHPSRAIVRVPPDEEVIDAEWVRVL
jgi:hypothetical protein